MVGLAPSAAKFAGFNEKQVVWLTLMVSGGAAGLAGTIEIAGPIGQIIPVISPGYGFTAIIVAFLGRLHPIGCLLAGLLMALTYLGGDNAQIEMNLPNAVTGVFQGMLLFFLLASDVLVRYRIRSDWQEKAKSEGLCEKIGISVYSPAEIELLISRYDFDYRYTFLAPYRFYFSFATIKNYIF